MRWTQQAAGGLASLAAAVALSGCGGNSEDTGTAAIRLLNASPGYAAMDLYVDDSQVNRAVAQGAQGSYASVDAADALSTVLTAAGASTALSTTSRTFSKGVSYTLVAYGWQGALKTALVQEDVAAADSGKAKLMVMNLASDAGTVDVYLTGTDESLDDATAVASGVAAGSSVGPVSHTAGTFRLRVTGADNKADLRLDVSGLTLGSTQVANLLLTPGSGGVLVHGLLSVQKGALTTLANTQARARVVASVAGNGRVGAAVAGTTLAGSLTSPGIGSYTSFTGSSAAPVSLTVNGSTVSVANQNLPAGGDYTLLVWGTASAPQVTVITDDNRLPSVASNAKLRVLHAINGLDAGLTLSADFSALASNVALGTASSYSSVAASSALRLEVSSPLSSTPLYQLTDAVMAAKGLYTVFMLGDSSSVQTVLRKER